MERQIVTQGEVVHQLILGLPGSGKTTFIAALWHVIESDEVEGALKLAEVHGVRDYLNGIRKNWLDCQDLERTRIGSEHEVSFRLRDASTGSISELILP